MRRREEKLAAIRIEIAARRPAGAGADARSSRSVHVHGVDLIAPSAGRRRLEDQPPAVRREIRFGVFAAARELTDRRAAPAPAPLGSAGCRAAGVIAIAATAAANVAPFTVMGSSYYR